MGEGQPQRRHLRQQLHILSGGKEVQGEPLPVLQNLEISIMEPSQATSTTGNSLKRSTSREGLHLYQVLGVNKDAPESEIRKVHI